MTTTTRPEAPTPAVCAVRYCLACGRAALATGLGIGEAMGMRSVGASLSACCVAHTALLLLPITEAARTAYPAALPEIVHVVPAQPGRTPEAATSPRRYRRGR